MFDTPASRFFIRQNGRPANRVSLRLAVDAGSIQEEDDQRGLAHFIEHMAFNGTEHFKPGELVAFLESIGARFGPHVNASTSFDETIYMLDVPTDRDGYVDKGLLALRRALPMPALNYVASKLAMALCFSSIIFVLLALAGAGIGGVRLAWEQWLLLGLVIVPGVLPFCALGLLVASYCSGQAAPAVINLIYLPMALLAGLWLPLSALPAVFQTMAPLRAARIT